MAQSYHVPSPAAALLQLARIKSGLSQGQLGELAGVPATMISAYERDRRQPTIPTLMGLLEAAGFELSMRLVPSDPHDQVLAGLDSRRSKSEHLRRDREINAWRNAEPADVTDVIRSKEAAGRPKDLQVLPILYRFDHQRRERDTPG
jgi:transcriptional regulator with XRE-family HTH domain